MGSCWAQAKPANRAGKMAEAKAILNRMTQRRDGGSRGRRAGDGKQRSSTQAKFERSKRLEPKGREEEIE
jgi:hypothetical protein